MKRTETINEENKIYANSREAKKTTTANSTKITFDMCRPNDQAPNDLIVNALVLDSLVFMIL